MSEEKPRIVLDCNVYLQAVVRETSRAAACLRLAENRFARLFISRQIVKEVQHVLSRDSIRERFDTITDDSTAAFISRIRNVSELVRTVPRHFDYQYRDIKDEPYINLAVEVQADYLVSRNNDLLDLMRWDRDAGREFQKRFRFLKVVTPEVFLAEMKKRTTP